jgi:SAM-dependent methyltransferase
MEQQLERSPADAFMNPVEISNIARAERDLWWYRGQRQILSRFMAPHLAGRSVERVLEAGCGTGYQSSVFEGELGWEMYPADLDFGGLRQACAYGVSRLAQADLAQLPYADDAFDAVVCLDVVVHFPPGREGAAFAELARVLRPGGLLLVRVSALNTLRSRHSIHTAERQRFTKGRLEACVREAGVEPLDVTYANSLLLPVALFKFRVWEPLTSAAPQSGVRPVAGWLNTLLYAPLALESIVIGAGFRFPLGQSLLLVGAKRKAR